MPHLVEMDRKYRAKGLRIIAAEVQESSREDIEKFAKDTGVTFPITTGTTEPPEMNAIPRAVVFDPAGKLVFYGHPGAREFDETVEKALAEVKLEEEATEDDAAPAEDPLASDEPLTGPRNWTNTDGREIIAELMAVSGGKVRFRMPGGKTVDYEIANLSAEDQEFLKGLEEEED